MKDYDKMISRSHEEMILENKANPIKTPKSMGGKATRQFVPRFFPYAKITSGQYENSFYRAIDKRIEVLRNTLKANEKEYKNKNVVMCSIVFDIIGREMRELIRMKDAFAILCKYDM